MSTYSKLYWLTRLDYFQGLFFAMAVIFGIILIVYCIGYAMVYSDSCSSKDEDVIDFVKNWKWAKKIGIIFLVIGSVFSSFIPSKDEVIFIIAGGKTIDFVQKDTSVNKIPANVANMVATMLETEIKKLKTEDKK